MANRNENKTILFIMCFYDMTKRVEKQKHHQQQNLIVRKGLLFLKKDLFVEINC
jgi:hypothetical protein